MLRTILWRLFHGAMVCYAQQGAGPYTATQTTAGRAIYQANCSSCHAADLSGLNSASALAGGLFMSSWGDRTPEDLIAFLEGAMPPGESWQPGRAGVCQRHRIHSRLQRRASWEPTVDCRQHSRHPFSRHGTSESDGRRAAAAGEPLGGRAEAPVPPTPRGLVVAGEVKNYTPVTDAMLRNPDPSDWLMIRHDYHANNYSPLNQITTQNVKDLQLQWVWAMNEGTNQPAPVVHNGVMFINNPGNIVQALDARKGDLIWENRIGPTPTGSSQRGLAIYNDKMYVTTSDAHIYALDARTGKNVWDTVIGDRKQSNYSTSSGPIVIKGKVVQGLGDARSTRTKSVSSAPTMRRPAKRSGGFTLSRRKANSAATPGASFRICSARAARRGSPAAMIPISI